MSQGQKAGDEPSVPLTDASLRSRSWGPRSLARIQVLLRLGATARLRLSAREPKPNIISQNQGMKTGGKESRRQHNTCLGVLFPQSRYFSLYGESVQLPERLK